MFYEKDFWAAHGTFWIELIQVDVLHQSLGESITDCEQ
jgi:hypothetical protein